MAPPRRGHFVLHSNVLPPVTAGAYELVSGQTGTPFGIQAEHTHVHVSSPRYTMPPEQILSTFPPANAEGSFGDRLPQIVLERRTLPWERNPAGSAATSPTPWLALVVVAEGEASLSAPLPVEQCVTRGTSLPDPSDRDVAEGVHLAVTETVVAKIFPTQEDLPLLTHVREVDVNDTELAGGDHDGWSAVVLANRLPVFDTAADKPVRYMACLVNLEGQLDELPPPVPPRETFEYVVAQDWAVLATLTEDPDRFVMGSGLAVQVGADGVRDAGGVRASRGAAAGGPVAGPALHGSANAREVNRAEAWSREPRAAVAAAATHADASRLVRDTMGVNFHLPIEAYAVERVLRFPVLAHWSFTTTDGATFETLMQDLDVGLLGSVPEREATEPEGPEVVETGHVGLDHQTRRGDATQAWYRGPFVPHPTDRDGPDDDGRLPVAHAADQLRRVVPDGREDLSYAAAYEIGRLLALSQLSVVSALLRFRQEQFGAGRVQRITERIVLPELLSPDTLDLRALISRRLVEHLAADPVAAVGPSRPVADPGRPIELVDVDEMVAGGLGLDLVKLRELAGTVGVAAALAATDVPLVALAQEPLVEAEELQTVTAALDAEVARLAELATPARREARDGAPGDVVRDVRKDVLDELIERMDEEER